MTFKPDSIIVHCSDTEDSGTVSWPAIRDYHVHVKGWKDIGYHAGVELTGAAYEALLGRPWDEEGAHCEAGGMNRRALGVCCIGSFDTAPPPEEQLHVLAQRVLLPWMRQFSVPKERIYLHREFEMHKTCPGKMFTKDLILKAIGG